MKTVFSPYLERDERVRSELARILQCSYTEVQSLPWKEILSMANELGIDTDYR